MTTGERSQDPGMDTIQMTVDKAPASSRAEKYLDGGDAGQEKGGTQKFQAILVHSLMRGGLQRLHYRTDYGRLFNLLFCTKSL
ncbi:MAG: hypothetical protein ACOC38_13430 [Promethearchaeia archaeon]